MTNLGDLLFVTLYWPAAMVAAVLGEIWRWFRNDATG